MIGQELNPKIDAYHKRRACITTVGSLYKTMNRTEGSSKENNYSCTPTRKDDPKEKGKTNKGNPRKQKTKKWRKIPHDKAMAKNTPGSEQVKHPQAEIQDREPPSAVCNAPRIRHR